VNSFLVRMRQSETGPQLVRSKAHFGVAREPL
jgi:hypothetical protein